MLFWQIQYHFLFFWKQLSIFLFLGHLTKFRTVRLLFNGFTTSRYFLNHVYLSSEAKSYKTQLTRLQRVWTPTKGFPCFSTSQWSYELFSASLCHQIRQKVSISEQEAAAIQEFVTSHPLADMMSITWHLNWQKENVKVKLMPSRSWRLNCIEGKCRKKCIRVLDS